MTADSGFRKETDYKKRVQDRAENEHRLTDESILYVTSVCMECGTLFKGSLGHWLDPDTGCFCLQACPVCSSAESWVITCNHAKDGHSPQKTSSIIFDKVTRALGSYSDSTIDKLIVREARCLDDLEDPVIFIEDIDE
jgi:hypothetical protein